MLEVVAHPGEGASKHVRSLSDDDRLPCGLTFARARFERLGFPATAEEALEDVTCPGCRAALERVAAVNAVTERRIA